MRRRLHEHFWVHGLPLKMRFRKSRLYISVIPPALVGFAIGVLSAVMGVGGGFMLVPAMIYLLGMPTSVVIGTSLFQVVFVTANVTLLQAVQVGSVDIVLTLLLLAGGVAGAQFGAAMGAKLRGEETRALLGLLVLVGGASPAVGPAADAGQPVQPSGRRCEAAGAAGAAGRCCLAAAAALPARPGPQDAPLVAALSQRRGRGHHRLHRRRA